MKKYYSTCLILLLIASIHAQKKADFIIIGYPRAYRILNKYQQPLTDKENARLLPFSPFQIVTKRDTLGDGLTSAVKVRYRNETYYLQKDEDGNYITNQRSGYIKEFRGCRLLEDSIKAVRKKAVFLYEKYPTKGRRQYIAKGKLVIRLFKYQNYYYMLYKDVKESFGWCSSGSKSLWKSFASLSKEDYTLSRSMQDRIKAKMRSINGVYEQYFKSFNDITGEQRSVPQWECQGDSKVITCTLSGSYRNSTQLEESSRYVVQDLENMLLGKPFEVAYTSGKIVIQLKKK
jgi:hypothetical protein